MVNAYLDRLRRPAAAGGRIGDLVGRRRVLLAGLVAVRGRVGAERRGLAAAVAGRGAVRQGAGGALAGRRRAGDGRRALRRPAPAGPRDRGLLVRRGARALDRPLPRRASSPAPPGWRWVFFTTCRSGSPPCSPDVACSRAETGPGLREGADVAGAALLVSGPDAGHRGDRRRRRARARGAGRGAARRLRGAPGDGRAAPASTLEGAALALVVGRQRRARAAGRRHVRLSVPRHPVLPARAGLQPGAGGPRRAAGGSRDRRHVAARLPVDQCALRGASGAAARAAGHRRRPRAAVPRARRRATTSPTSRRASPCSPSGAG